MDELNNPPWTTGAVEPVVKNGCVEILGINDELYLVFKPDVDGIIEDGPSPVKDSSEDSRTIGLLLALNMNPGLTKSWFALMMFQRCLIEMVSAWCRCRLPVLRNAEEKHIMTSSRLHANKKICSFAWFELIDDKKRYCIFRTSITERRAWYDECIQWLRKPDHLVLWSIRWRNTGGTHNKIFSLSKN